MTSFKNKLSNFIESVGRNRLRRELMAFSDRQLEDFGISRYMLEQGVSAWPWRIEAEKLSVPTNVTSLPLATMKAVNTDINVDETTDPAPAKAA